MIIKKIQTHFHKKTKLQKAILKTLNTIECVKKMYTLQLNHKKINIYENKSVNNVHFLYKQSQTITVTSKMLKKITKNLTSGFLLVSNSCGIMTSTKALLLNLGGTILCYINTTK